MTQRVRIFVNGFGRIGRTVVRQTLHSAGSPLIEDVEINDVDSLEICAYLLRYDSVYGPFPSSVEARHTRLDVAGCVVLTASCSTNALAPFLRGIDLGLAITQAHVTMTHRSTGSQRTLDQPVARRQRSRTWAVSMVPTTTSASEQVIKVLPKFRGRLSVAMVRVPCISVSSINATLQISEEVDECLVCFRRDAFANSLLMGRTDDTCVSTDFRGRRKALIIALPETQSIGQCQLCLFGCYDKEWSFATQMRETAGRLATRPQ